MTDVIKVFGNVGSPYTQKILALLRYRNIPYTVSWGDVVHNLSLLKIEPPKPVLLPTLVLKNEDGKNNCKTDTTPIIRYLEEINKTKSKPTNIKNNNSKATQSELTRAFPSISATTPEPSAIPPEIFLELMFANVDIDLLEF